jgi:hypothetical protein
MLAHDYLLHYGVKGMTWDRKKVKQEANVDKLRAKQKLQAGQMSVKEYKRVSAEIDARSAQENAERDRLIGQRGNEEITEEQYQAELARLDAVFAKSRARFDKLTAIHKTAKISKKSTTKHVGSFNNAISKLGGKPKRFKKTVSVKKKAAPKKSKTPVKKSRQKEPTVPRRLWNNGPGR